MQKVELLSPAGNLEKLIMAISYGADAVYLAGEAFSLRAYADNFSEDELAEGIKYAHDRGKKVFMTMNIIAHNTDLTGMAEFVRKADKLGVDALIVSDPGVLEVVKENAPNMEIHLSTQANTTNWRSCVFWHKLGVKRIILAREMSFKEIKEIRERVPESLELEAFVHGSMCVSYSGRCLLSNFMTGRDANKGQCAHPCRYNYALVEEKRPGIYFPIEEDDRGSYIMNSKDLCMIEHIPELVNSGINSFKIEGRIKSSYYAATVTSVYRKAIDAYYSQKDSYQFKEEWLTELAKASHREWSTGFFFGKPSSEGQIYDTNAYLRDYSFVGLVKGYDPETGIAEIEQRNRMFEGEEVEILKPDGTYFKQVLRGMKNEDGETIDVAPHPKMKLFMKVDKPVEALSILRRPGEQ